MPVFFLIGAAGGVGSVLARRLAEGGAALALAGRRAEPLRELATSLGATSIPVDASSFEALEGAVNEVLRVHGRLDGIVNCAGSLLLKPAHQTTEVEWRETVTANLDTAFATVRAGARAMLKSGGSIVLMSSAAGRIGLPNHEAIAAAKAGVVGLALSAAATYAARGIRVNVVAPGLTRTPLTADLLRSPASEAASLSLHPLGRLGEPEDVASAIQWLLAPAQSWITGQVLGVDGGLSTLRRR
jgi:NAD(P)-dependent dehydrogenase (short-subunit alcohol dehydrogenase family)